MITEDYVSFEVAKLLKEKGFDARCPMIYTADGKLTYTGVKHHNMYAVTNKYLEYYTDIIAPSQTMVMKWLREVHNLYIEVSLSCDREDKNAKIFDASMFNVQNQRYKKLGNIQGYEQACEAAIKYCLENLI